MLNFLKFTIIVLFLILSSYSSALISGSLERDVLVGDSQANEIEGGPGDDILVGGDGNDVYKISVNHGHDTVFDSSGANAIQFDSTITFSMVSSGLMRSGDDIIFRISEHQTITVKNFFIAKNTIAELRFTGGSKITSSQLYGAFGVSTPTATIASHQLILGSNNSDTLVGNASNNIILSGIGNDRIEAKGGYNIVVGGRGDDDYYIESLVGKNYIIDTSGYNRVVFSGAIPFASAANYLYKSGDDLIIKLNNNNSNYVQVKQFFKLQDTVSEFYFESVGGAIYADQLYGLFGVGVPSESQLTHDVLDPYSQTSNQDDDFDGVINLNDLCPNTPEFETVNADGCSQSQLDDDNDGVPNSLDSCPATVDITTVDQDGCSDIQRDSDSDGLVDYYDQCPATTAGSPVNEYGCAEDQIDTDGDDIPNHIDPDDDNDGVPDVDDAFPLDPNEQYDLDGDGVGDNSDLDIDNDGYSNQEELSAGTDPLDWRSNAWSNNPIKNRVPKTSQKNATVQFDDGYYQSGAPKIHHRSNEGIVYDKLNGIAWQDQSINSTDKLTYDDAYNYCDSLSIGNRTNWRLPSYSEVLFLFDHMNNMSYIEESSFLPSIFKFKPDSNLNDNYYQYRIWTRSPAFSIYGRQQGHQMAVSYDYFSEFFSESTKTRALWFRCVSNDEGNVPKFLPNYVKAENVVADTNNNIMWQDSPENKVRNYSWEEAVDYCESLNYAGKSDWRVPTINEAITLAYEISFGYEFSHVIRFNTWFDINENSRHGLWTSTSDRIASSSYKYRLKANGNSMQSNQSNWMIYSDDIYDTNTAKDLVRCVRNYGSPVLNIQAIPNEVLAGDFVLLDASSSFTPEGGSLSFVWSNLSTGQVLATVPTVNFIGTLAGDNFIELQVTDNLGVTQRQNFTIRVIDIPSVSIVGDIRYHTGSTSELFAQATSSGGDIVSYVWTDVQTGVVLSNQPALILDYSVAGHYQIQLSVTDAYGSVSTQIIDVYVGTDPVVNINAPSSLYEYFSEGSVSVQGQVSGGRAPYAYKWYLDGVLISENAVAHLPSTQAGVYSLSLEVVDEYGFTGQATQSLNVITARELVQCPVPAVVSDDYALWQYPAEDIPWISGSSVSSVDIERAFNYARSLDPSVSVYLKLPEESVWNSFSAEKKGLYLINAEREARGLKPFAGLDPSVNQVASEYAEYIRSRNQIVGHFNDGHDPSYRLNEKAYIEQNSDYHRNANESISQSYHYISDTDAFVRAIYLWLYNDKFWYENFDHKTGNQWAHRDHILTRSYLENHGSINSEGVVGFGLSVGQYDPEVANPNTQGYVLVVNTVDQGPTWNSSRLTTVDTSQAHVCQLAEVGISNNDNLEVVSLKVYPSNVVLLPGQTESIRVVGEKLNGTIVDLTNEVEFYPDIYSNISIVSGMLKAIRSGSGSLKIRYGNISTHLLFTVNEEAERELLLSNIDDLVSAYIPDNASYWNYDTDIKEAFNSYNSNIVSIYTGLVVNEFGMPLSGVTVSFINNPRLGTVETDTNGRYIIAGPAGVNNFNFEMTDRLPVQRKGIGSSNNWANIETVMLLPFDTFKTEIDITAGGLQVHRSSITVDDRGSRKATVIFNGITHAKVVSRDGRERVLDKLLLSATEHKTPLSMPGALPKETAYTYCAELHVEGVRYDETVKFNGDVVFVVDNFLDFEIGEIVPVGTFNTITSKWDAERNGIIAMVVDTNSDGVPDGLDYTGDGIPDDLNGNGSTVDEISGLGDYSHGDTIMWSRVNHFTAIDLNWSQDSDQLPLDFDFSENTEDHMNDEYICTGSYVMPSQLSFHDDIPIIGTDLTLHYSSQRTKDYKHKITVKLSGDDYPIRTLNMIAKVEIGGHVFERVLNPAANLSTEFMWDGRDINGNYIHGIARGIVSVGFEYSTNYLSSGNAAADGLMLSDYPTAWATIGNNVTFVEGRDSYIAWSVDSLELKNSYLNQIANGWSISNIHEFDKRDKVYKGDGSVDSIHANNTILSTGINHTEIDGDDGYYKKGGLREDYYISPQGTLIDKITGLIWSSTEEPFRTNNLQEANAYCDNLVFSGRYDWRLPTYKEQGYAKSKAGRGSHPIYGVDHYWSHNGGVLNSSVMPVYCVAGEVLDESLASNSVRNHQLEVVVDKTSGLMWQDTYLNKTQTYSWASAISACEFSSHADFTDWRLPNVNELLYSLPNTAFMHVVSSPENYNGAQYWENKNFRTPYWSSTPNISDSELAWAVEKSGFSEKIYKRTEDYYVRCVRDDTSANRTPFVFDGDGRHKKTIDIYGGSALYNMFYDAQGRIEFIDDAFGNRISIERDSMGVPLRIVSPYGFVTNLTIVNGNLVSVSYDDSSSYQFTYDGSLLTRKIDRNGHAFDRAYDQNGRAVTTSNPIGGLWTFFDDAVRFDETHYGYETKEGLFYRTIRKVPADGVVRKTTLSEDETVSVVEVSADGLNESNFNATGSQLSIVYSQDEKTLQPIAQTIEVKQPSQKTSITQISKQYFNNGADLSSYVITTTHNGSQSSEVFNGVTGTKIFTSAEGRVNTVQMDPNTLLLQSVKNGNLHEEVYQYDTRGRLVSLAMGTRQKVFTYGPHGMVTSETAPNGDVTNYYYDSVARLVRTQYADGHSVYYQYDLNGNRTALTVPTSAQHGFAYNSINKVSNILAPLSGATQFNYDQDGRLVRTILPSGQYINRQYQNGKLSAINSPEGTTSYTYNVGGQVASITKGIESLHNSYDGDLLVDVEYRGALNKNIEFSYNNNFDITALKYAGVTSHIIYDNDRLLIGSNGFTIGRDAVNGLPVSISSGAFQQTRSYNNYAESTNTNHTIGASSFNTQFTYNSIGKITQKIEFINGVSTTYQYVYDLRNRLSQVMVNGVIAEAYTYDANGNRLTNTNAHLNIAGQVSTYSNGDQLLSSGNRQYAYDQNGRLSTKTRLTDDNASIVTSYEYSSDGRLLRVVMPSLLIEYMHNTFGNPVTKSINGTVVEKYLWLNNTTLLAVYDGLGNLIQRFEYTIGHTPSAFVMDSQKYFIIADQIGTPRIITNSSGVVVKELRYDSFGNIIHDSNPNFNIPFGFAGGFYDKDTGLVRFGYRDYDPEIGRWTARDPIGFEGGDTNLYGYVLGDPILFIDPDGLRVIRNTPTINNYNNNTIQSGFHKGTRPDQVYGRQPKPDPLLINTLPQRKSKVDAYIQQVMARGNSSGNHLILRKLIRQIEHLDDRNKKLILKLLEEQGDVDFYETRQCHN